MPRTERLRTYVLAATTAACLLSIGPAASAAAAASPTQAAPTADAARTVTPVTVVPTRADQAIAIARSKLGHRWVFGATGPKVFDCSGLVIYSFRTVGIARVVGTSREASAFGLYARFRARGLASRTNGQRGDLVIWGGGTHVGIYLGNGMAISALVNGIRVHAVRALTTPFTAYLHTGIATVAAPAVPRAGPARAVAGTSSTIASRRVTTTALRLRSGPSTAARVLRTLPVGTKMGVVRVARDRTARTWYRVLVRGRLGWIAGRHTRAA